MFVGAMLQSITDIKRVVEQVLIWQDFFSILVILGKSRPPSSMMFHRQGKVSLFNDFITTVTNDHSSA